MKIRCCIKDRSGNGELRIHCQPRASKTEIVGFYGESLKVRLMAPPIEGQANSELCRFLAEYFEVPRKEVQILSGKNARQKRVLIKGKTAQNLQDRLEDIVGEKNK